MNEYIDIKAYVYWLKIELVLHIYKTLMLATICEFIVLIDKSVSLRKNRTELKILLVQTGEANLKFYTQFLLSIFLSQLCAHAFCFSLN